MTNLLGPLAIGLLFLALFAPPLAFLRLRRRK